MSNTKNPMINPLAEAMPPQPERRRFLPAKAHGYAGRSTARRTAQVRRLPCQ